MTNGQGDPAAIPRDMIPKVRLIRTGAFAFMSCLGGSIMALPLGALLEIIGGPVLEATAAFLKIAAGLLFAGCFVSFGLILAGALKRPREADPRPYLSSALPCVVLILCAAMGGFAIVVFGGAAWIVFSLYRETGVVIFLSAVYFLFASAFFALAVCCAIAWKAIRSRDLPLPLREVASRLAPGRGGGPGEEKPSRGIRILTRVDAILGSAFGIAFGLLMERAGNRDPVEMSGSTPSPSWFMIVGATILICIFATIMVLRGIRVLIDLKGAH